MVSRLRAKTGNDGHGIRESNALKTRIARGRKQQWQKQGCGHDRVRDGHRSRDRGWGHSNSPPWCHKILFTLRSNCLRRYLRIRLPLASRITKAKAGARMGLPSFSSFGDHSSCCFPRPYSSKQFQQSLTTRSFSTRRTTRAGTRQGQTTRCGNWEQQATGRE